MTHYRLLKLIGLAVSVMILIVIGLSIEVAIYSIFINPGKNKIIYEQHATQSLPWIAGIIGFFLFFFIVKYWAKRQTSNLGILTLLFFLIYISLDFIIVLIAFPASVKISPLTFVLANGAKLLGSITSYYCYTAMSPPRNIAV